MENGAVGTKGEEGEIETEESETTKSGIEEEAELGQVSTGGEEKGISGEEESGKAKGKTN